MLWDLSLNQTKHYLLVSIIFKVKKKKKQCWSWTQAMFYAFKELDIWLGNGHAAPGKFPYSARTIQEQECKKWNKVNSTMMNKVLIMHGLHSQDSCTWILTLLPASLLTYKYLTVSTSISCKNRDETACFSNDGCK